MENQLKELTIKNLLLRLDEWRFYPKFQLERHFDVLLSFVLPELLWKYAQDENSSLPEILTKRPDSFLSSIIIPEFPLALSLFDPGDKGYLANAADFAIFIPGGEEYPVNNVLFIELKTDESSARDSQTTYMNRIQTEEKPFKEYLEAIIQIILNSKHNSRKYLYLLKQFSDLGLLQGLEEMFSSFKETNKFFKKKYLKLENISKHTENVKCCSLVIAPEAVTKKICNDSALENLPTLSFKQAVNLLKQQPRRDSSSAASYLIADCLEKWDQSPMQDINNFLSSQE